MRKRFFCSREYGNFDRDSPRKCADFFHPQNLIQSNYNNNGNRYMPYTPGTSTTRTFSPQGNYSTTDGVRDYRYDKTPDDVVNAARQAAQDQVGIQKQVSQGALETGRQRDQDVNQAGRSVAFQQANTDESKTNKQRIYDSEEKALDRAKSSKEFNAGLGQQDKQVAQNRSDMEYQIMMADRNSEKARNFETFTRANDNLNQRAAQTADINSNEKLANISQQTSLSGQKSQEEQARIAAKAQVTSALMGSRSNYGGYW